MFRVDKSMLPPRRCNGKNEPYPPGTPSKRPGRGILNENVLGAPASGGRRVWVGSDGRSRLTKADLEAMLAEFEIAERYGESASIVNRDLLQIRRSAMFGEPLEQWARARGVPLAYARALRRFLDQG